MIISPVTNRRIKLRDSIRGSVTIVVLLDFHNTIDRYFVPGRRPPFSIQFPNNRPTLLPDRRIKVAELASFFAPTSTIPRRTSRG